VQPAALVGLEGPGAGEVKDARTEAWSDGYEAARKQAMALCLDRIKCCGNQRPCAPCVENEIMRHLLGLMAPCDTRSSSTAPAPESNRSQDAEGPFAGQGDGVQPP
jgi:hypothetical protein